jgi:putative oxidoreductase
LFAPRNGGTVEVERETNMTTSAAVQEMADGSRRRTRLHVGLWVAQGLLAAAFGLGGLAHATQPIGQMATMAPWTGALPEGLVRFIGVVELAGALGLVLPGLTRLRPGLTAWAAAGLATVMALAMVVHIARGEPQVLPVNLVLGGAAAFIAWGRGMKVSRT